MKNTKKYAPALQDQNGHVHQVSDDLYYSAEDAIKAAEKFSNKGFRPWFIAPKILGLNKFN